MPDILKSYFAKVFRPFCCEKPGCATVRKLISSKKSKKRTLIKNFPGRKVQPSGTLLTLLSSPTKHTLHKQKSFHVESANVRHNFVTSSRDLDGHIMITKCSTKLRIRQKKWLDHIEPTYRLCLLLLQTAD